VWTFALNAAEVTVLALTPVIIWPGLYVMAFQPNALPPAEENAEDISSPTLEISSEVHRWTLWAFEDAWGQ
jgi:hypothetical protein